MAVTISNQQDEITYQELIKFMQKKARKGMSSERLLAVASNLVGKLMALQDQRTMTSERAHEIIVQNIALGNLQIKEQLMNVPGGNA